jgi:hypothetical protein
MFAAGTALLATGAAGLASLQATASSHREAPLISGQPEYDNTDVYAFVSPDKPDTTTLIANFLPFQEPAGGPNFFKFASDAAYDVNLDTDGDAQQDIAFRFTFKDSFRNPNTFLYNTGPVTSLNDPDLNFRQTFDLEVVQFKKGRPVRSRKLASKAQVAPSNVGKASMPDYKTLRKQAIKKLTGGGQAFAGQADDPFFADLRVFDLLYGANLKEVGNDTLRGYNVNTVALQVPTKLLASAKQPIVGVFTTVSRRNASGKQVQVSRLGAPLVNEVVLPVKAKDRFNGSKPKDDAQFGKFVTNPELPKLIEAIYKIKAPAEPRNDLVQVFLTGVPKLNQPPKVKASEMLRLNTSIKPAKAPKRLGVLDGDNAGFPNGRRLTDDVIDISLQAVEGELLGKKNDLGDAVDSNDQAFEKSFPYVAQPIAGSEVRGGAAGGKKGANKKASTGIGGLSLQNASDLSPLGNEDGQQPMLPIALLAAGIGVLLGGGVVWLRGRPRTGDR